MLQQGQDELSNSGLAQFLNKEELELLISHSKILAFGPGETILQQGKEANGIYVILDGMAISSARLMAEGTTKLETLGPGNFFGEVSFIEKVPSATSIISNTPIQCILISEIYLQLLTEYFPETKYKLFQAITKQMCERLKKMHQKVTDFMANSDMVTRSLFVEIIHSLTKPTALNINDVTFEITKLSQASAFRYFSTDEFDELINHSEILEAPKNCTLIRKDEKNASCYIVIRGAVQSSIMHANKAAKLSVIGPATLFAGIACIQHDSPFTITFATCEHAVLIKIAEEDLAYFEKNKPKLWYKIFGLICHSIAALEKSVDKLDIRLNIETYNR